MLLAQMCAQAIDRARLYEAERQARAQAELARDRLAFLAQINIVLAADLDYESRLDGVAHLVVSYLADGCVIDILEKNSTVRRVTTKTRNAAQQPVLPESEIPDLNRAKLSPFVADVLYTGSPNRYPEVPIKTLQPTVPDTNTPP